MFFKRVCLCLCKSQCKKRYEKMDSQSAMQDIFTFSCVEMACLKSLEILVSARNFTLKIFRLRIFLEIGFFKFWIRFYSSMIIQYYSFNAMNALLLLAGSQGWWNCQTDTVSYILMVPFVFSTPALSSSVKMEIVDPEENALCSYCRLAFWFFIVFQVAVYMGVMCLFAKIHMGKTEVATENLIPYSESTEKFFSL